MIPLLIKIATTGQYSIYNVASGINVSNRELLETLESLIHCQIEVLPQAKTVSFPPINIQRIREEFGFQPSSHLLVDLPKLVAWCQ